MNMTRMWKLASVYAGGTLGAQLITVGSLPFLARLYPPAAFGRYATVLSVVGVLSVVATLRLEQAIQLPRCARIGTDLRRAALYATILTALLSAGVAVIALAMLGTASSTDDYLHWAVLLPALCIGNGIFNILIAYAGRCNRASLAARAQVLRVAGGAGLQLVPFLLPARADATTLLLATLGGILCAITMLTGLFERVEGQSSRRRLLRALAAVRLFKDFPKFSAPQGLIAALINQSPTPLLMALADAHTAGQFAMADRIVRAPILLISGSIRQGFVQGLADAQRKRLDITGHARALSGQIALVLALPVMLACVVAPWVVTTLMGPQWHEAARTVQLMVPSFYLNAVAVPMAAMLQVARKMQATLAKESVLLVLKTAALVAAALCLGPWPAVLVAAIAPSVSCIVTIALGVRSQPAAIAGMPKVKHP